jgi:hypothetical protein
MKKVSHLANPLLVLLLLPLLLQQPKDEHLIVRGHHVGLFCGCDLHKFRYNYQLGLFVRQISEKTTQAVAKLKNIGNNLGLTWKLELFGS